jgi:alkyl hydroperoxide reductase subunit AhpC/glutaredoxin
LAQFEGLHTQVLGISVDSIPSLKAWAKSLGGITYPLLSDFYPHGEVAQRFGVLRKEGHTERAIFVIDKQGKVCYRDIHDINEQPDNEEVFEALRQLEPEAAKKLAEAEQDKAVPQQPATKQGRGKGVKPRAEAGHERARKALRPEPAPAGRKQPRKAGRKQPTITLYCTPWCTDCRTAKQYLDERGFTYNEVDVSKSKAEEKKARDLAGGKLVTPTIDIGGTVILDFDQKRLDEVLGE